MKQCKLCAFAVAVVLTVGGFCPWTAAVEITVGRLYEADFVELMKGLASEYQAAHPDVSIQVLDTEREQDLTTYEKAVGPLPDVYAIPYHVCKRVHELPYCVRRDLLVPVEELAGDGFLAQSDFFESLWRCIEYQGKHWGVPYYAESYGVLARTSYVPPALLEAPPRSWGGLKQLFAASTQDADGDGTPNVWGVEVSSREDLAGLWLLLAYQLGARFWDGERFHVAGDPALADAFRMVADLRDTKVMKTVTPGPYACAYVQSWQFNDDIERTSGFPPQYWSRSTEHRVIPLPNVGTTSDTMPVLNVYLGVKRSTPEKQAACWEFVRWATSPEVLTRHSVVGMGFLPIHNSAVASPEFQERVAKMPQLAVFVDTLKHAAPVFPYVEKGNQAFQVLAEHFLKAFGGELDLATALKSAEEKMNKLIEQPQAPAAR